MKKGGEEGWKEREVGRGREGKRERESHNGTKRYIAAFPNGGALQEQPIADQSQHDAPGPDAVAHVY